MNPSCSSRFSISSIAAPLNVSHSQYPVSLFSLSNGVYAFSLFAVHGALDFTEKLEIWTPIIKVIAQQPARMTAYHGEVMMKLVDEIMRRTQFEINKPELELLDNELMEDDVRIECTILRL